MGRYVTGKDNGFEYQFAFGDQSSSFGDVLERLCSNTQNRIELFTGENGEIVRLYLDDKLGLINEINQFIEDYRELTTEQVKQWQKGNLRLGDSYWDKYMMKLFLEQVIIDATEGDSFEFEVEY